MQERGEETRVIREKQADGPPATSQVLFTVYQALQEKGYDPMRQIAYYLITGEPAYITAYAEARKLMSSLERDEVIEELVRYYLTGHRS